MEWGKIKTMFIYLFLFLNIVLASYYAYTIYINKTEVYQEKDAIIRAIKNDGIEIVEPVVKKDTLGYVNATVKDFQTGPVDLDGKLNYNYELVYSNGLSHLVVNFSTELANVNAVDYKQTLDTFIAEKLTKDTSYIFEGYDKDAKIVRYRQTIDGLTVFDNNNAVLDFTVSSSGGITSLKQKALTSIEKNKTETIANHNQVIYKLYHDNYIPTGSRVVSTIGYYTSVSQLTNQVLIPTWKIEVTTGTVKKTYYVDAINITILDKSNK